MRVEAREHEHATVLLDVADRDLVLRGERLQHTGRAEPADAVGDLLTEHVALPEVDAERVASGERESDRDLARMLARLERERRVLREDRVRAAEQHLRDSVGVTGIALQVEADLRLERLQILLVFRSALDCDVEALEA